MIELAALLLAAAVAHVLARLTRLPLIPVLLVVGKLVAVAGWGASPEIARHLLELGLAFLVFAAGMELHAARFKGQRRSVAGLAIAQFLGLGVAGYFAARGLGVAGGPALYVAVAIATSSTFLAVRQLRRQEAMTEPLGRLVTGALLVQDLIIVTAVIVLAGVPDGWIGVAVCAGGTAALLGLALVCRRWVLPWLIVGRDLDDEVLLLLVVAVLFGFVGAAAWLGLPLAAGAFVAGLALARFPLNGLARGQLSSLTDFFVALFFVILASSIEFTGAQQLGQAAALIAVIVLIAPPLITWLAQRTGLCTRAALESGLILAQGSEFALVLGLVGLKLGHLDGAGFSLIALVTAGSMMLNPFIAREGLRNRLLHWHPGPRRDPATAAPRGHVLVLGFGAAGMWVVKPLLAAGHRLLVVDDDPVIITMLERQGIPCQQGDAADSRVLLRAGAREAKLVLVATRRARDAEAIIRLLPGVPVIVRVFEEFEARRIEAAGGTAVLNSLAAADTFMAWFDAAPELAGPANKT
ncbi:MAG: cation:proton antiporter [Cephaloticoccus sp.]|nr:cation:proton antiporter [Cephaloticoccus sp.]